MHPKWRCVFHIQPEREPCSGEGHDHHGKKRRTIGWVCKSIAEATNLAFGCNLKKVPGRNRWPSPQRGQRPFMPVMIGGCGAYSIHPQRGWATPVRAEL